MKTKFTCPNCGTEFSISSSQPATALPARASDRITALRNAGVDVSNFFAMRSSDGSEYVGVRRDGNLSILPDDDPIYKLILSHGTIPNGKLFRRWVMSQMFHMLAFEQGDRFTHTITAQIHRRGYRYSWQQIEAEINAQMHILRNGDKENFADRNRWFNRDTVISMLDDYIVKFRRHIDELPVRHCKGVPYKRIGCQNVFLTDIDKNIIQPVKDLMTLACKDAPLDSLRHGFLLEAIRRFRCTCLANSRWSPCQSSVWMDAYKGAGAFFTMQNLIRFHGCTFVVPGSGARLNKEASYRFLKEKAVEYTGEGWRLIGLLRQFLKDNHIDIRKKMAEWRKG